MGGKKFLRQYQGLIAKNYYGWKADCCGCCLEITFPVLTMLMILGIRAFIAPNDSLLEFPTDSYRHAYYNPMTLEDGEWTFSLNSQKALGKDNAQFMEWANYTNDNNGTGYSPIVDLLGPAIFHPFGCYGQSLVWLPIAYIQTDERLKPVIAYIQNDNEIEQEFISFLKKVLNIKEGVLGLVDILLGMAEKFGFDVEEMIANGGATEDTADSGVTTDAQSEETQDTQSEEVTEEEEEAVNPLEMLEIFQIEMPWEFKAFKSYDEIKEYMRAPDYMESTRPGICFGFNIMQHNNSSYEVELMFNDQSQTDKFSTLPSTQYPVHEPLRFIPYVYEYILYAFFGFANIQNWIADIILKKTTGNPNASIVNFTVPFFLQPFQRDSFRPFTVNNVPIFISLMYIPLIFRTTVRMATEKRKGMKDQLASMGTSNCMYYFTWWSWFTICNLVISLFSAMMLCLCLPNSSYVLIFLWVWLYGQSLFPLIMMCQTFINNRYLAGFFAIIFSLFQVVIKNMAKDSQYIYTSYQKGMLGFFMPFSAFYASASNYSFFDLAGFGVTWHNYDYKYQDFSFQQGLLILLAGNIFWFIVAMYLELVSENYRSAESTNSKGSTRLQKICFCLTPKYWGRKSIQERMRDSASHKVNQEILIDYLKSMELKKGNIYGLVGHYGSGKTKLIKKIASQMSQYQATICDESIPLYEKLTALEHIKIYNNVKSGLQEQGIQTLEAVKVPHGIKVGNMTHAEQKRLQVVLALNQVKTGDPTQVIVLDNPCSQLNSKDKRIFHQLLAENKSDHCIIMTTTSLSEAIKVCDIVGFIQNGQVMRVAKTEDLVKQLGIAYKLTLNGYKSSKQIKTFLAEKLGQNRFRSLTKKLKNKAIYQIAQFDLQINSNMLKALDENKQQLGVDSYEFSLLNADDIFIHPNYTDLLDINKLNFQNQSHEFRLEDISDNNQEPLNFQEQVKVRPDQENIQESAFQNENKQSNRSQQQQEIELKQIRHESNQPLTHNYEDSSDYDDKPYLQVKPQTKKSCAHFCVQIPFVARRRIRLCWRYKLWSVFECLAPFLFIFLGTTLIQVVYISDPKSIELEPSNYYEQNQRLIVNPNVVNEVKSNVLMEELLENLPQQEVFDFEYVETYDFYDFQGKCWSARTMINPENMFQPYLYGSYQVYSANTITQQYKYVTYVNMTSPFVVAEYQQYMYQSVLQTATDNPDFQYKVINKPLPVIDNWITRGKTVKYNDVTQVVAVFFAFYAAQISFKIVTERYQHRYYQYLLGLDLKAYWFVMYVTDLIKLMVASLVMVQVFNYYEMQYYDQFNSLVFMFCLGLISYIYVISCYFKKASTALVTAVAMHYFAMYFDELWMGTLRVMKELAAQSSQINLVLSYLSPSVILTDLIFYCGGIEEINIVMYIVAEGAIPEYEIDKIAEYIEPIQKVLVFHIIFWPIILILIESQVISKLCNLCKRNKNTKKLQVVAPTQQTASQPIVKVQNVDLAYSKVLQGGCCQCRQKGSLKTVLNNVSFDISKGQCLSIILQPGYHKALAFRALANQIRQKVKTGIGIAFKKHFMYDQLTVTQNIEYFAQLQGIFDRSNIIKQTLMRASLTQKSNQQVDTLTNGEQSRLQIAIAMINNPKVVMIEDPWNGLNPEDAFIVHKMITAFSKQNTSGIILAQSSCIKAQLLASDFGLLSDEGKLLCVGSEQFIKDKLAYDNVLVFNLTIKKPNQDELQQIQQVFFDRSSLHVLKGDISQISFSETIDEGKNASTTRDISNQTNQLSLNDAIKALETNTKGMYGVFQNLFELDFQSSGQTINIKSYLEWVYEYEALYRVLKDICQKMTNVKLVQRFNHNFTIQVTKDQNDSFADVLQIYGGSEPREGLSKVENLKIGQASLQTIYQEQVKKYPMCYNIKFS